MLNANSEHGNRNSRPGPVNTNLERGWYMQAQAPNWPGSLNRNLGPGPVNKNLGARSVNTNWGPGLVNTNWGPSIGPGPKNTNTLKFKVPWLILSESVVQFFAIFSVFIKMIIKNVPWQHLRNFLNAVLQKSVVNF